MRCNSALGPRHGASAVAAFESQAADTYTADHLALVHLERLVGVEARREEAGQVGVDHERAVRGKQLAHSENSQPVVLVVDSRRTLRSRRARPGPEVVSRIVYCDRYSTRRTG